MLSLPFRYMTKQGYAIGLDDVFLQIADDKLLEFVQAVVSAHKACLKKLGELVSLAWVGGWVRARACVRARALVMGGCRQA